MLPIIIAVASMMQIILCADDIFNLFTGIDCDTNAIFHGLNTYALKERVRKCAIKNHSDVSCASPHRANAESILIG